MKTKYKLNKGILISLIISFILSLLFITGFFSNIQVRLSDGLYGGKSAREDIVILAIDDKSLQEIGRWPWDRNTSADIITLLNNAKVVAVDVAFFEESDEENDMLLADAISYSHNVVVPMEYVSYVRRDEKRGDEGDIVGNEKLLPIKDTRESASGIGYINIITDSDGVTRSLNLDIQGDYDSFVEKTYEIYTGNKFRSTNTRFLINFIGKPGSFNTYSFTDVLNGRINSSFFKDKAVFIGATSPDLHDDYFVPTSLGKAMPGVEIHANTLQTMLNNDFLSHENYLVLIITILVSSLIATLIVYRFNTLVASLMIVVLALVYVFISIKLFDSGIIMNLIYVPLSLVLTEVSSIGYFYFSEKREKDNIRNAFGKYVSPEIINELMDNPSKLNLGGEKREITIFFSDIRSFTSIAEKLSPEELVHLLNEYLSAMTDIIMKRKGIVDKYIGDAIMAFWGAPLEEKEHARLSCEASLEMCNVLGTLNQKWLGEGKPEITIGIGIHTGEAIVGNMGSDKRFDYTVMGDTINLGSRLEGLTKKYGVSIIISETTKKKLEENKLVEFVMRELDFVTVKGKEKPVRIYELVVKKEECREEHIKLISLFEQGIKEYHNMKWDNAIKLFRKCLEIKEDNPSRTYIERCLEYKKNPPKDWNKVWVMKDK